MLGGVHQHHTVLVEEALVALDDDAEVAAILEREPRTSIGEDVRVHRRGGVERRAHAGSRLAVPRPLLRGDIDARFLPKSHFRGVGAALVAARDERGLSRLDLLERGGDVLPAGYFGWIALRPDQHEVVVHDVPVSDPVALAHEPALRSRVVHEDHVGVPAASHVERLAGAQRDDAHPDPGALLEDWQDEAEES